MVEKEENISKWIKEKALRHFGDIKKEKSSYDDWYADYEEAGRMYRFWDQMKYTVFGILFSAVIIVMGITFSNYDRIPWYLMILSSTLTLILIWTWVIFQIRLETGVHVIGIYMKAMEIKLFDRHVYVRNFGHYYAKEALDSKLFKILEAKTMYKLIFSSFSGVSILLPILKYWPTFPLLQNNDWINVTTYAGLLLGFVVLFWLLYGWLVKDMPSEKIFDKKIKDL